MSRPVKKKVRLKGPRPPAKLVRQIVRNSAKNGMSEREKRALLRKIEEDDRRAALTAPADPLLQDLFQEMADGAPGRLSMTSFKSGSVRLRLEVAVRPPGSPDVSLRKRDFEVRLVSSASGLPVAHALIRVVEVRVRGLADVLVSAVPSAVLAVALR